MKWQKNGKQIAFLPTFMWPCVDMAKDLGGSSCAHYPPSILSPCPNMSSLDSLKHHHFMDKSRLRGGDVSKINMYHHNVWKVLLKRGLYQVLGSIWSVANLTMHRSDLLSSYHSCTPTQGNGELFSLILISALSQRVAKRATKIYVECQKIRSTEQPVPEKYL